MAQLCDDCFAFGGELMKSDEALQMLADRLDVVVGSSDVGLRDALGRILSADIRSEMAVPPHDNAAIDGYAVRFSDLAVGDDTRLKIIGRVAAGQTADRPPGDGETIRIFTGAAMPPDADTVLMQEDCREEDGTLSSRRGLSRVPTVALPARTLPKAMSF